MTERQLRSRKYARRRAQHHGLLRIPITTAAERLQELSDAGLGLRAVSERTGLCRQTLQGIRNQTRRKWVSPETYWALMACEAAPHGYVRVPAKVSQRMLQSLIAIGWTTRQIDQAMGKGREAQNILQKKPTDHVWLRTQDELHLWWEKLSGGAPEPKTRFERQAQARARNYARQNGWPPPMAWDNILDPNEKPKGWKK